MTNKRTTIVSLIVSCMIFTCVAKGEMVAYLPFESGVDDALGNLAVTAGGDATVTFTDSAVGSGALALDGNSDYLDLGDSIPLGTDSFSVSMWVNLEDKRGSTSAYRHQLILNGDPTSGTSASTQIFVNGDGTLGFFCAKYGSGASTFTDVFSVGTVDDANLSGNDWRHVAIVVDRSVTDELELSYYIDGEFDSTTTKSFSSAASLTATGGDSSLYLGYSSYNSDRATDGLIDDVHFYNEALTADQIGQIASVPEPSVLALIFGMAFTCWGFRRK